MQIIEDRRALHKIPETGFDLPCTLAYLRQSLEKLNCTLFSPIDGALCAFFDFGRDSAIAFRADIDALPMEEKTGLFYASQHKGYMHACGHDGHAAIALELARRVSDAKRLRNNILLIFQPAEESIGGAKPICQTGIFEAYHVKAVFGLHLWPELEAGEIFSRKGALMSRSSELTVEVTGKAAHISTPDDGADSLAAAAEFYCRARQLEKDLCREDFCLLNFGSMQSGTARNILSDRTRLYGCLRTFREDIFERAKQALQAFAAQLGKAYGCSFCVHLSEGYPAILNPDALFEKVQSIAPFHQLPAPVLATEDSSWYQHFAPGMFFFLSIVQHRPCTPTISILTKAFSSKALTFLSASQRSLYDSSEPEYIHTAPQCHPCVHQPGKRNRRLY